MTLRQRPGRRHAEPFLAVNTSPLQSRLLASVPDVVHGITRRVPGLGSAEGNIGYSHPRDQEDAWRMREHWCASLGLEAGRLVTLRQVHGSDVLVARAADAGRGARPGSDPLGTADALIAAEPGVALFTIHADCMPILLVDPVRRAIASVHAGWRGTTSDVAGATVAALVNQYGTEPRDLLAFLAPAIGVCCYEVGEEVIDAWRACAGPASAAAIHRHAGRWRLDLRAANRHLLLGAGLVDTNLDDAALCTSCASADWFSHRGQGPATGRFGAIIALREPHHAD